MIGTDIPELTQQILEEALRLLDDHEVQLVPRGPVPDAVMIHGISRRLCWGHHRMVASTWWLPAGPCLSSCR